MERAVLCKLLRWGEGEGVYRNNRWRHMTALLLVSGVCVGGWLSVRVVDPDSNLVLCKLLRWGEGEGVYRNNRWRHMTVLRPTLL